MENCQTENRCMNSRCMDNRRMDNRHMDNRRMDSRRMDNRHMDNRRMDNRHIDNRHNRECCMGNRQMPCQSDSGHKSECPDNTISPGKIYWGDLPIGMGYVPSQMHWKTYSLQKGLSMGTIFPELCKPFCGKGGGCHC